jgi:toxin ParE1/3/4
LIKVEIHSGAYIEIEQARLWYENQANGLGIYLLDEIERAIDVIRQFPDAWPVFSEETRRFLLHHFPYAIIYRHNENKIQVFAVMHLHRKPGYWKDRKF